MTEAQLIQQFQKIEDKFNKAVLTNEVSEIKNCITTDWVLIDHQGIISRDRFFDMLEQGMLLHTTMTKMVLRVKLCGDIALVSGRGQNTGTWKGRPLKADEWVTDIYRQVDGNWLCMLTQLTSVKNVF